MDSHRIFTKNNNISTQRANLLVKTIIHFKSPFESQYILSIFEFCRKYLFPKIKIDDNDFEQKYAVIATGAIIFAMAYQKHLDLNSKLSYPLSLEFLLNICKTSNYLFNFVDGDIHTESFIKNLGRMVLIEKELPFNVKWFDQFSNRQDFANLKLKEIITAFKPISVLSEMVITLPFAFQSTLKRSNSI